MADHELDVQSDVFRNAQPAELVSDEELASLQDSGFLINTTDEPVVSAEEYEAGAWDAGREGPKSLDEAKAALAERVENPLAPDRDASVYDDLERT